MKRWFLAFVVGSLIAVAALVWSYPAQMLAPGPLIPAHADVAGLPDNCFACHTPVLGASGARCMTCHKPADIGLRTVAGAPVERRSPLLPFHQDVASVACMECHSDHPRPSLVPHPVRAFAHSLLAPAIGADCAGCHVAPQNALHPDPKAQCSGCHNQTDWDAVTVDHQRFFALTGPHDAGCTTCHTGGDLTKYTCYGCHEHQEAATLREHQEEGIRSIDNCVACHRSADDDGREGGKRDDDDD